LIKNGKKGAARMEKCKTIVGPTNGGIEAVKRMSPAAFNAARVKYYEELPLKVRRGDESDDVGEGAKESEWAAGVRRREGKFNITSFTNCESTGLHSPIWICSSMDLLREYSVSKPMR